MRLPYVSSIEAAGGESDAGGHHVVDRLPAQRLDVPVIRARRWFTDVRCEPGGLAVQDL